MKGFISYAHDDLRMLDRFRTHLTATADAFDIAFWADERVAAGQRLDDTIRRAIDEAHLFILLLSPAYLASTYVREQEIPAITARVRTVTGLICPVILKHCAWNPVLGELQVVPTRGRRVMPIAQWQPQDRGYDEARMQIEAAIRLRFNRTPKVRQWFGPLIGLREEQPGPIWVQTDSQFDLDPTGSDADNSAAADRVTMQLHALNRQKAVTFAAKIGRLANGLGDEWEGLIPAATNLAELLEPATDKLPDHIALLWEASVRLASFLELDKRLLSNRSEQQNPLPDDILRALDDLISSVAPWVRRFPTARGMDEDRSAILSNPTLFPPAVRVIQIAEETRLITPGAAESLRLSIQTAERGEFQGQKAATYTIKGARGLVTRSGSYVAGFLGGALTSADASRLPLIAGIGRFLAKAESSLEGLTAGYPADIRYSLGRLISNAGKPGFPGGKGASDEVSMAAIASQTTQVLLPEDFDRNLIREMILRGATPPPSWRPFITALDFSTVFIARHGAPMSVPRSLSDLTELRSVNLRGMPVSDLSPLAKLTALQELDIGNTNVSDLSPLAGLTALLSLDLRSTPVTDVTSLSDLIALESLDLGNTDVRDVTPLARLKALRRLNLRSTKVGDVTRLAGLTGLQRLDLGSTQIDDLTALAVLTALRHLDISRTRASDLTALVPLSALQHLDVSRTRVYDLTPLVALRGLQFLDLSHTQVGSVIPLAGLTALQSLILTDTRVTDVSPLDHIPGLSVERDHALFRLVDRLFRRH